MIKITCAECCGEWYIESKYKSLLCSCPYCLSKISKPTIVVDSFQKALLKTVLDLGIDCLVERTRFLGYLMDISSEYKREIRILSNACNQEILREFYETRNFDRSKAKMVASQIQRRMIEEEGLAEQWAILICDALLSAIHPQEDETAYLSPPKVDSAKQETGRPLQHEGRNNNPLSIGDKVQGRILSFHGNCADIGIGMGYSAYMYFSKYDLCEDPDQHTGRWHLGDNVEAFVIDINEEFHTAELDLCTDDDKADLTMPRECPDRTNAQSNSAWLSNASDTPVSNNSYIGFDGIFAPDVETSSNKSDTPIFEISGTTLTKYNGDDHVVIIPEGITEIGFRAFYKKVHIVRVILPKSLREIKIEAFWGCTSLSHIHFNEKVWNIGAAAFGMCSNLKKLRLPKSVLVVGSQAFINCTSLEEIEFHGNVSNLLKNVFDGCCMIKRITAQPQIINCIKNNFPASVQVSRFVAE